MDNYVVKPLSVDTWDAFPVSSSGTTVCSAGVGAPGSIPSTPRRRHRGGQPHAQGAAGQGGRAHAALVFDGDEAVAWAQYGAPAELPNIHHRKEYEETFDRLPDYRITCIFVDKKYRRTGVTAIALRGAIDLIAQARGGVVEGYPHDTTDGKKVSVLYNATRSLYEEAGFESSAPKARGTV